MKSIHRLGALLVWLCGTVPALGTDAEALARDVEAREKAFARTMADRDFEAFQSFISEEAVFLGSEVSRGRAAVAAAWSGLFADPEPPFSWAPERVQVLDSGTLALSTGPVWNSSGRRFSTFTSTWRLEADGQWRVIFDKGDRWCPSEEETETPAPQD